MAQDPFTALKINSVSPLIVSPLISSAAPGVAYKEIAQISAVCADQTANTLLMVSRELTEAGVRESYRIIPPQEAGLDQFAIYGSLDEEPHQH